MPAAADEGCANTNIFASTRNTIHVHRHLQRTGILSYHRHHQQQMRSQTHRRALMDASTLSTFMDASLSAHLCCAVCTISSYSARRTAGGKERAAGFTPVPRTSCAMRSVVETRHVHAVSIKQQLEKPTRQ